MPFVRLGNISPGATTTDLKGDIVIGHTDWHFYFHCLPCAITVFFIKLWLRPEAEISITTMKCLPLSCPTLPWDLDTCRQLQTGSLILKHSLHRDPCRETTTTFSLSAPEAAVETSIETAGHLNREAPETTRGSDVTMVFSAISHVIWARQIAVML